jgi:hypothetical protein
MCVPSLPCSHLRTAQGYLYILFIYIYIDTHSDPLPPPMYFSNCYEHLLFSAK